MRSNCSSLSNLFKFTLLLLLFSFGFFNATLQADEQPGPVKTGGSCTATDGIYHFVTSQRTEWQINELYAVPVGTKQPELWDQYLSFNAEFVKALQEPQDVAAFASACASIWNNFFSNDANVLVSVRRAVTGTDDILQCQSGLWTLTSTQTIDQNDTSEWLYVGTFDVSKTSADELQQFLQSLVDGLNSQPGGLPANGDK